MGIFDMENIFYWKLEPQKRDWPHHRHATQRTDCDLNYLGQLSWERQYLSVTTKQVALTVKKRPKMHMK